MTGSVVPGTRPSSQKRMRRYPRFHHMHSARLRASSASERTFLQVAERFRYSMEFEMALLGILGRKGMGKAGLASDAKFVRKSMLEVVDKWRQRIRNLTAMDERLDMMTTADLGHLEAAIKATSAVMNNDWLIISALTSLVNRLLGYDWVDGEVHRHLVFFRDRDQENFDHNMMLEPKDAVETLRSIGKTSRAKYALIDHLRKRIGLTVNEVANVMGMSEYQVRNILVRIGQFEKKEGSKFSDISNIESAPLIYDDGYRNPKDLTWFSRWGRSNQPESPTCSKQISSRRPTRLVG